MSRCYYEHVSNASARSVEKMNFAEAKLRWPRAARGGGVPSYVARYT